MSRWFRKAPATVRDRYISKVQGRIAAFGLGALKRRPYNKGRAPD